MATASTELTAAETNLNRTTRAHQYHLLVLALRLQHEELNLALGALEVVDAEGVHTDVLHAQLQAPLDHLDQLQDMQRIVMSELGQLGQKWPQVHHARAYLFVALLVALVVLQAVYLPVTTVAVHDEGHMLGNWAHYADEGAHQFDAAPVHQTRQLQDPSGQKAHSCKRAALSGRVGSSRIECMGSRTKRARCQPPASRADKVDDSTDYLLP